MACRASDDRSPTSVSVIQHYKEQCSRTCLAAAVEPVATAAALCHQRHIPLTCSVRRQLRCPPL